MQGTTPYARHYSLCKALLLMQGTTPYARHYLGTTPYARHYLGTTPYVRHYLGTTPYVSALCPSWPFQVSLTLLLACRELSTPVLALSGYSWNYAIPTKAFP